MVTRIQKRRRYWFLLTILVPCLLLFLLLPWQAAIVLLILLSIFLAGSVDALWRLFQRWPSTPSPLPQSDASVEEERPSYQQGYQEVYYQPSVPTVQPLVEDQPQAEYPQQYR